MPLQGAQRLARRNLPEPDHVVITTGGQGFSIWTPGYALNHVGVSLEGLYQLAGGAIPELHRFVAGTRGQGFSVRTPRHTQNQAIMLAEHWTLPERQAKIAG